jgi:MFS family permease
MAAAAEEGERAAPLERTTLMTMRVVSLAFVGLNEAIVTALIWPFLPALVERFGKGHDGLYVGIMASSFFLAQLLTAYLWGSVADSYGRRLPLLLGVLGSCCSMIGFGLSSSYWEAVFWRMAAGALNGNVGITKVLIGELASSKTQARAFGLLSFNWGLGSVIGPMIGGLLADLGTQMGWGEDGGPRSFVLHRPFALPSLVGAGISFSAAVFGFFFLRESEVFVRPAQPWQHLTGRVTACCASSLGLCSRLAALCSSAPRGHQRLPTSDVEMADVEAHAPLDGEKARASETTGTASTGATLAVPSAAARSPRAAGEASKGGEGQEGGGDAEADDLDEMDALTPIMSTSASSTASAGAAKASPLTIAVAGAASGDGTGGTDGEAERADRRATAGASTGSEDEATSSSDDEEQGEGRRGGGRRRRRRSAEDDGGEEESVWTVPVKAALALYGICAIGAVLLDELFPVLATLPPSKGGYGLSSLQVGYCLTTQGLTLLVYQGFLFGPMSRALSPLLAFKIASVLSFPMTLLMPLMALTVPRHGPISMSAWVTLQAVMVCKSVVLSTMFSTTFVLITNAARGRELGRVNGVGQTIAAAVRTVGPGLGGVSLAVALMFGTPSPPFVMSGLLLLLGIVVAHLYLPSWTNLPPNKDAERRAKEERDETEVVVPEFLE